MYPTFILRHPQYRVTEMVIPSNQFYQSHKRFYSYDFINGLPYCSIRFDIFNIEILTKKESIFLVVEYIFEITNRPDFDACLQMIQYSYNLLKQLKDDRLNRFATDFLNWVECPNSLEIEKEVKDLCVELNKSLDKVN